MQIRRHRPAHVALATVVAASVAPAATAELLMEFTYVGSVWNVIGENPEHPWGGVELGDEATFTYVIDVEQEDQSGVPWIGRYEYASAAVSFDGISVDLGGPGDFTVNTMNIGGSTTVDILVDGVFGFVDGVIFELRGFGSLPSDAIPIDFELDDFNIERGVSYGGGDGPLLQAEFDSYSYRVIPGRGAWCLLLGGSLLTSRRRS